MNPISSGLVGFICFFRRYLPLRNTPSSRSIVNLYVNVLRSLHLLSKTVPRLSTLGCCLREMSKKYIKLFGGLEAARSSTVSKSRSNLAFLVHQAQMAVTSAELHWVKERSYFLISTYVHLMNMRSEVHPRVCLSHQNYSQFLG